MDKYEKIEKTIRFLSFHIGTKKELGKPTLLHSINVGLDLLRNGYKEDIIIAGLLHDIIEDTKIQASTIKKEFGNNVLKLVLLNTKKYNLPKNDIDKDLMIRCLKGGKESMVIKASDIYENREYFSKTKKIEKIKRIKTLGKLFLSVLPNSYNDVVFERLRNVFSK